MYSIDKSQKDLLDRQLWQGAPWSYVLAFATIALMTGLIYSTHADAVVSNVTMLYLLGVSGIALFLGSYPAIVASLLAFLALDFFFVEPRFQLNVDKPEEWFALFMFLLTAIINGQLITLLRKRAEEAQQRKAQTDALAEASWAVASELDRDRALNKVLSQVAQVIRPAFATVLLPDLLSDFRKVAEYTDPNLLSSEVQSRYSLDAVTLAITEGRAIGWDEGVLWQKALAEQPTSVYLPIMLENEPLGVLYLTVANARAIAGNERHVVNSLVNHAAVILQRDKLMKAQARAEALTEADKLKTALLSMVSHDFRSPLTSIKASVSSLLQEGEPLDQETQRSLLAGVDQETDRLNRMVGNILDFSRLEAGAWKPRYETVEATEVIGSALDALSHDDNARIQVIMGAKLPELLVDPVQIVQVVKNLLENALKYSLSDQSKVELNVHSAGETVIVEVLDRGSGLPKGDEEKIFDSFYRAPGLKESAVPGVGLGLALCKGLVEANGGILRAVNREGGGAVFRISLPADLHASRESDPSHSNNLESSAVSDVQSIDGAGVDIGSSESVTKPK